MIDFGCSVCGSDLEVMVCADGSGFNVTPCGNCIAAATEEGYGEGYNDGERLHDEYI